MKVADYIVFLCPALDTGKQCNQMKVDTVWLTE
eukprot:SAG31_NODE_26011_length_450_cov_0.857550_1_plen_32_part_10